MLPAIDRIGTGEQYAAKSGRRAVTRNQTSAARLIAAAIVLCAAGVSSAQQPYPAKPIRIISPYAPGGTTDVLARLVGSKLTESWGQPILVEPRPGGNTVIGSEIVTKSAPDGYTLLSVLVSHVIVPNLMATPYDAVKDFAALGTIATTQLILLVHPSVRWGADMAKVLAMPDVREKLLSQGMDPFISTPDEFAALIKADHAKFARIIKTGNIKLEQ